MLEKKQLFNFLHDCVNLFNQATGYVIDQNSTDEFDKNFKVDEQTQKIFDELREQNCMFFINRLVSSPKIRDILLYTIANFDLNLSDVN